MAPRAELRNWFYGFTPPERGAIVLGHRRVYIVPSRLGLLFGGTLLILLLGSINYALALGFGLTFLLAGMGLAGMVQTARNLAQLRVRAARTEPVFAGEAARFRLELENPAAHDRPEILVRHLASGAQATLDIGPARLAEAALAVPAARRGWLPLGRVMLETRFPLGLFRAWSYVEPDSRCLVYPRPEASALPPLAPSDRPGGVRAHAQGADDFSGLRAWQVTDSPRQVAWKSVARNDSQHLRRDPMLTKQFAGEAVAELWLGLEDTPATLDLERRLSRLAAWVLAAERAGVRYGLRLPGVRLGPDHGDAHRAACLEALALHE
ncbi:MAG TPA: DUF58 domain-containing protein [Burkholderiales bacterium]|jgi:uncharacterized protein (DUF58 family)|nr:DUF58 domain-containing protein [Burkholderiales bacterium]